MGAIADAWATVKQELANLKAQNATLQSQVSGSGGQTLDDSDLAAIADLESEAAAVNSAAAAMATPVAPTSVTLPALPAGPSDQPPVTAQPSD